MVQDHWVLVWIFFQVADADFLVYQNMAEREWAWSLISYKGTSFSCKASSLKGPTSTPLDGVGGGAVNISTYEFWQDKSIQIITLSLHSVKKKEKVLKKTPEQPLYRHSDPMWGQLFYRLPGMIMSGQFISLPWFLSHCNKNSEWWTKRYRTTDRLQLSSTQADRSLIRHFHRSPPYLSYQSCLASTF